MGMDVIGSHPVSERGRYFALNTSGWPVLWRACLLFAPSIAGKVHRWDTNDGDGLGPEDSQALADVLVERNRDGSLEKYFVNASSVTVR